MSKRAAERLVPGIERVTTEHGSHVLIHWPRRGVRRIPGPGRPSLGFERDDAVWTRAKLITPPTVGENLEVAFSGGYLWGDSWYRSSRIAAIKTLWAGCPVCQSELATTPWGLRCWRCAIDPRRSDPSIEPGWQEHLIGRVDDCWIKIRAWLENRAPWSPAARRRRRERKEHAEARSGADA